MIQQPEEYERQLLSHQLSSAYSIEHLESYKVVEQDGILIDTQLGCLDTPSEAGKTATMVAVILRDRMMWDNDLPHVVDQTRNRAGGLVQKRIVARFRSINPTLVLTDDPETWENELAMTNLKYMVFDGTKKHRHHRIANCCKCNVVIVSPMTHNKVVRAFPDCAWKRFVYDISNTQQSLMWVTAGFYWFMLHPSRLSASPRTNNAILATLNADDELLCEVVRPVTISVSLKELLISATISVKRNNYQYHNPVYNSVHGLVSQEVSEAIATNNIKEAMSLLGGSETSDIIQLVKNAEEKRLTWIDKQLQNKQGVNPKLYVEREAIVRKLLNLELRMSERLQGPCAICLGPLTEPTLEPQCQNLFCGSCLLQWLQKKDTCPVCRSKVGPHTLTIINDDVAPAEAEEMTREMTQIEVIEEIIGNGDGNRVFVIAGQPGLFNKFEEHMVHTQHWGVIGGHLGSDKVGLPNGPKVVFVPQRRALAAGTYPRATDLIVTLGQDEDFHLALDYMGGLKRQGMPITVHCLQVANV